MFVGIKYYDSVNCVNRFIPWLILANSPASLAHTEVYAWKRNEGDKDINSLDGTDRKHMYTRPSEHGIMSFSILNWIICRNQNLHFNKVS